MTTKILLISILYQYSFVYGQVSLKKIDLNQGPYTVGFKHYTKVDSTRTYQIKNEFNNQFIFRPIPISIWYPAKTKDNTAIQLTILDYLEVLKEEEEWKNLPNHFLFDWFPYLWNTSRNRSHAIEKTTAFARADLLDQKFPVVIYAPSYQASSIENFALFEYLASNGFVVISSPSRGTETRWLEGGTTKDLETQSRDIEFLLKEIYTYQNIDTNTIALMGFSFGGLSNTITAMKNPHIKVLVSLDGTERYRYDVLERSAFFDLNKLNLPYVHFAQKNIPKPALEEDKMEEALNYKFQLYDSLQNCDIYRYKFHHLTHSYFSSFGVLFGNRDKRQDKSDDQIMISYKLLCEHSLHFLNATLKNNKESMEFIKNGPEKNGLSNDLISKKTKKSLKSVVDYKDFNDAALRQNYQELIPLYKNILAIHPNLELREGMLNTLGLRLSFNPKRIDQGINVLLLALHIYPESANLYDSLAEAYLIREDYENAIINFKKSLELNPENKNATDRLKQFNE